jgi:GH15 family glucan-1,4-alpha-glucosidase
VAALVERSLEVIRAGQHPSGAYVACPAFEPYRYSWLRDGAFIADAMREAGKVDSADRFFDWVGRVVMARPEGPWDARYRLDGSPDESEWPKLQIDGLGLWLGALRRRGDSARWDEPAAHVRRWLEAHWHEPCIDWWEEREGVHAVTLWCVANGLGSEEIRREALARADERLDGSLLFIGRPELVARVEAELVPMRLGVHRHHEDEYYGGGQWLLLTALLGLAYVEQGRRDEARACLAWIEAHARPNGDLPEQSQDHLLRPERYEPWVEKWGEPASPLLWSHAMYLRLCHALTHAPES